MTLNLSGNNINGEGIINPPLYNNTSLLKLRGCKTDNEVLTVLSNWINTYRPLDREINTIYIPMYKTYRNIAPKLATMFGKLIIPR